MTFLATGITLDVVNNVSSHSAHSYLINFSREDFKFEWISLPDFLVARSDLACGLVKSEEGESFIVVAGGSNGDYVDVVEMLSLENPVEWMEGPEIPTSTFQSSSIQLRDRFMITGGNNGFFRDSVYEFGVDLKWHVKKSLKKGRNSHVMFAIPDEWANCS